jgi:hypothetical protein
VDWKKVATKKVLYKLCRIIDCTSGYAMHGHGKDALELFEQMQILVQIQIISHLLVFYLHASKRA